MRFVPGRPIEKQNQKSGTVSGQNCKQLQYLPLQLVFTSALGSCFQSNLTET